MDRVHFLLPSVERETMRGLEQTGLVTSAFSDRKIFLFGTIDEQLLDGFMLQMMELQKDTTRPISIYINSTGGIVPYGLVIYDLIQNCPCEINMYTVGVAYSLAAVIFAGGQEGRRFITGHGEVMIHEPLLPGGVGGSASSIKTTAESILKTRDTLNRILAVHTCHTVAEIEAATNRDNYMTAQQAVDFGICDEIVDDIGGGAAYDRW